MKNQETIKQILQNFENTNDAFLVTWNKIDSKFLRYCLRKTAKPSRTAVRANLSRRTR
jgi:hypothetical protein